MNNKTSYLHNMKIIKLFVLIVDKAFVRCAMFGWLVE